MIHMVDAAGTEGRDPVADIKAINKELEAYNPQLLKKPQVIAANKIDAIAGDENEVISALRAEFEPQGIKVFPISAVSGKGLKELLYEVKNLLANCPKEVTVYEPEIDPALSFFKDEPYAVEVAADGAYEISGPKIEKMLGYTNMDSEKGFAFSRDSCVSRVSSRSLKIWASRMEILSACMISSLIITSKEKEYI